ncbi:predicted protein [Histoplasma mississippiense (nom. inval.)]|uniref:predicted protein n=1 Tax=Ajellomyces capsulatus (strain NAm1 / WU24) TaxID=2059318 RepID=UPI000157B930|nr:predicted protein [Histoplasma mississippiense (nom. inval.)]EDN03773.1 predicted protein [Histoplasma mississippiense (nom. inval.)]
MATFTEEEFEQLLRDFEDNAPSDFGQNLCSNTDLFEVELPQSLNFNTTPCPMDTTQTLEVQLAETQKDAFEDSMKTMDKLVQLHAELRSMKR